MKKQELLIKLHAASAVVTKLTKQLIDVEKTIIPCELDSQGYPYDKRIHAYTRTKNKDGSWKQLRMPSEYYNHEADWYRFVEVVKQEIRK